MYDSLQPSDCSIQGSPMSFINAWSLLRFMSIESGMLSNHLTLSSPFPFAFNLSQHQDLFQSWLFASDGQSTGASASALILPMNIQGWFCLGLTGLISLNSMGLSRVFSSTTIQNHKFFGAQSSSWSNSHTCTWPLEKHSLDYMELCQQSDVSAF